jgi:heme exporter protein CcmD
MLAVMEDAGFVIGSYVVTFGAIAAYAGYVLRRARRVTKGLPDEAKPWT